MVEICFAFGRGWHYLSLYGKLESNAFYLLQNLFRAHDLVAAQQLTPVTSLPDEAFEQYPMQTYGEDSVRIVQLQKTNEPLVRSF